MKPDDGDISVWWIPQVPGEVFRVPVRNVSEGRLVHDVLAAYDAFRFNQGVSPDYSNAGGVDVFTEGEWTTFEDEEGFTAEDDEKYERPELTEILRAQFPRTT